MTQPAGDLSPDEVAKLRQQLAAYPRLPLIPDEQQGGNEDGATVITALPRLLDELERRRGEDQALNLFRTHGDLVDKLASLVATARMNPDPGCGTCDHSLRYGACSAHVAKALIDEVREQRLVILTAEAADQVVRDLRKRAELVQVQEHVIGERARREAADVLRGVAEGRREYATNAPESSAEVLRAEATMLDSAARVVEGDLGPLYGWLPYRRWTDEMVAKFNDEQKTESGRRAQ